MNYLTATHTDIGTRKKTNQDSMIVMQAATERGQVLLASVCDGMGGLAKGEVASAAMVHELEKWFDNSLPTLLAGDFSEEALWKQWKKLVDETNEKIGDYGRMHHTALGTTCTALLIIDQDYYILNVGDSRIYLLADTIYQLTKDQTYVQREMDEGRMTYEQSLTDPQRSVLLQCIGASRFVDPAFSHGQFAPGTLFMLCCDGFRHVIMPGEFYQAFRPDQMTNPDIMKNRIDDLIRLNIQRNEDDNISAILVKTY